MKGKIDSREFYELYKLRREKETCGSIEGVYIRAIEGTHEGFTKYFLAKFHNNGKLIIMDTVYWQYPTQQDIEDLYTRKVYGRSEFYCIDNDSIKIESVGIREFHLYNVVKHGVVKEDSIIMKYATDNKNNIVREYERKRGIYILDTLLELDTTKTINIGF